MIKTPQQILSEVTKIDENSIIMVLYDDAIEAIEAYHNQFDSKWISVEDKLPESLYNVIVFYDNGIGGYVSRGYYYNSSGAKWDVQSYSGTINPKVTHWMPLPPNPTT